MKVEFIFDNKRNKFNPKEIEKFVNERLKILPFKGKVESVTVMSKWLVILIDFELNSHARLPFMWGFGNEEQWWEALAGYVVMNYDVIFMHWEVHGETRSLIFKKEWEKK